jgi:hypothetical protein
VVVFEPLSVEFNKRVVITNASLLIVDFDTAAESLTIQVEKFPKHGKLNKQPL